MQSLSHQRAGSSGSPSRLGSSEAERKRLGESEPKLIVHTVRYREEVVVIDHVPAEVCSVCGDVLLSPETVRHIEEILRSRAAPKRAVQLFEYA